MRITGRQLRRIIQEEVARMMNEEDAVSNYTADPATGKAVYIDPKTGKPYDTSIGKKMLGRLSGPGSSNLPPLKFGELPRESPTNLDDDPDRLEAKLRSDIKSGAGVKGLMQDIVSLFTTGAADGRAAKLPPGTHQCELVGTIMGLEPRDAAAPPTFTLIHVELLSIDGQDQNIAKRGAKIPNDETYKKYFVRGYAVGLTFTATNTNGNITINLKDINLESETRDMAAAYLNKSPLSSRY
jgi:hypothetical protein